MEQRDERHLPLPSNVRRNAPATSGVPDAAVDRALELVAAGHTITDATAAAGISRSTLWYRSSRDPSVAARLEAAKLTQRMALAAEVTEKAWLLTGDVVYEPVLGPDGEPLLDEDFEQVTRARLVDYDPQILGRLVNKLIPGVDVQQTNVAVQVNAAARVEDEPLDLDAFLEEADRG